MHLHKAVVTIYKTIYFIDQCHVRIRILKPYLSTATDDSVKIKLNVIFDVFVREIQAVHWCAMESCMGWCLGVKAVVCQTTQVSMSKCVSSSIGSKMSWLQILKVYFCLPTVLGPHHTLCFIIKLLLFFTHESSCMIWGILCRVFFSLFHLSEKVMRQNWDT